MNNQSFSIQSSNTFITSMICLKRKRQLSHFISLVLDSVFALFLILVQQGALQQRKIFNYSLKQQLNQILMTPNRLRKPTSPWYNSQINFACSTMTYILMCSTYSVIYCSSPLITCTGLVQYKIIQSLILETCKCTHSTIQFKV